MKAFTNRLVHSLKRIQTSVILTLLYLFGIGPTSLVARLAHKSFLETKPNRSTWHRPRKRLRWETMF
jgi:hypothetical protein